MQQTDFASASSIHRSGKIFHYSLVDGIQEHNCRLIQKIPHTILENQTIELHNQANIRLTVMLILMEACQGNM